MTLLFGAASCGITDPKVEPDTSSPPREIDTSVIAVLPYEEMEPFGFMVGTPAELSYEELVKIEDILNDFVQYHNREQEQRWQESKSNNRAFVLDRTNFIIELSRYKRQYIAAINNKEEKEVWINFFCDSADPIRRDWKKDLVMVLDGGNCYFNMRINIATEKAYGLDVNGEA